MIRKVTIIDTIKFNGFMTNVLEGIVFDFFKASFLV